MKHLTYPSLKDFCESKYKKNLNTKTLCIFDIDGIFFEGLTDPHFWFSNIKKEYLDELNKIVNTGTNIWIFTDRNIFGFWGPYKKQLSDTLSVNGKIKVPRYKGSLDFLKRSKSYERALILNAKKPGKESVKVLEKSTKLFDTVYYFGSQDVFFKYDDKTLVEKIKHDKINLYFIDIRK